MGHGVNKQVAPARVDGETARDVAQVMQALATPSRVLILGRLVEGPCSVGDLAQAVKMEQSAVSHQLRTLRHLRLVVGERRGREVHYALHDDHVATLLEEALYHVNHVHLGLTGSQTRVRKASGGDRARR
jgi:DNA-binding transcriptional ArsR family regulator